MSQNPACLATLRFVAEVIYWRGPSPYFFVALPPECTATVRETARSVSYGWGMIPVEARVSAVDFKTSLFPKDDGYFLPLKDAVRKRVDMTVGDLIGVEISITAARQ